MTYKGFEINEPTLVMFKEFIKDSNLPISAEAVFNHYSKKMVDEERH